MPSFQGWTEFADQNRENPFVVRARVMTELYVSFVWLRDSVLRPVCTVLAVETSVRRVYDYLESGSRRNLRNAVAHGRWTYLQDYSGIEYWDGNVVRGKPLAPHRLCQNEVDELHTLS